MEGTQETPKTVTDYLSSLVWDGVPRLDRWLIDYADAEDTPPVHEASRAILVAAVRRARDPGCRFDQMLVIDGPQGCGKSSALRLLAVEDAWFTDTVSLTVKGAAFEGLRGTWIVELGELDGWGRADVASIKPFLEAARGFVVVGTTCEAGYLVDPEGGRRLVLIRVKRFDLEKLRVTRDQLWAEAAVVEATGQPIWLSLGEAN